MSDNAIPIHMHQTACSSPDCQLPIAPAELTPERVARALAYMRNHMTGCLVYHQDQWGNPAPCPDGPLREARAFLEGLRP